MKRTLLALLIALASGAICGAAPDGKATPAPPEDFGEIKLNSLDAGFGLLRLGGPPTAEPLGLGGHVLTGRTDSVMRVLVDEASGTAFGYRLEAKALSSTLLGLLRIDISPLGEADEKELKR